MFALQLSSRPGIRVLIWCERLFMGIGCLGINACDPTYWEHVDMVDARCIIGIMRPPKTNIIFVYVIITKSILWNCSYYENDNRRSYDISARFYILLFRRDISISTNEIKVVSVENALLNLDWCLFLMRSVVFAHECNGCEHCPLCGVHVRPRVWYFSQIKPGVAKTGFNVTRGRKHKSEIKLTTDPLTKTSRASSGVSVASISFLLTML